MLLLKKRGSFTTRQTQHEVTALRNGRKHPIHWDTDLCCAVRTEDGKMNRIVNEIGAIIRWHVPMTNKSFTQLPNYDQQIVIDQLTILYEFDAHHVKLKAWIKEKAKRRFTQWRSTCRKKYKKGGLNNMPKEFESRVREWRAFCATFDCLQDQLATHMKEIRDSNTKNHNSGPTTYLARAKIFKDNESFCPNVDAYIKYNEKKKPEQTQQLQVKMKELKLKMKAQAAALGETMLIQADLPMQIQVLNDVIGEKHGTCIRGIGSLPSKTQEEKNITRE